MTYVHPDPLLKPNAPPMLIAAQAMLDTPVDASDGSVGSLADLLVDDETWDVRYLLLQTGGWLRNRQVLMSPNMVGDARWEQNLLRLEMDRARVQASPEIDMDLPITRAEETVLARHFDWQPYWETVGAPPAAPQDETRDVAEIGDGDPSLCEVRRLLGYGIESLDGEIGHLDDLIVDDLAWVVRYLVIDTEQKWPGRRVLVATNWVDHADWEERKIRIDLIRDKIQDSPQFDPTEPVNREYERELHDYYGRTVYWQK